MKVLIYNKETEPSAFIKCECAHEFWIDPIGEENLITVQDSKLGSRLVEQCPNCQKTNTDGHIKYPELK